MKPWKSTCYLRTEVKSEEKHVFSLVINAEHIGFWCRCCLVLVSVVPRFGEQFAQSVQLRAFLCLFCFLSHFIPPSIFLSLSDPFPIFSIQSLFPSPFVSFCHRLFPHRELGFLVARTVWGDHERLAVGLWPRVRNNVEGFELCVRDGVRLAHHVDRVTALTCRGDSRADLQSIQSSIAQIYNQQIREHADS